MTPEDITALTPKKALRHLRKTEALLGLLGRIATARVGREDVSYTVEFDDIDFTDKSFIARGRWQSNKSHIGASIRLPFSVLKEPREEKSCGGSSQ
jgi:hypothetical protein